MILVTDHLITEQRTVIPILDLSAFLHYFKEAEILSSYTFLDNVMTQTFKVYCTPLSFGAVIKCQTEDIIAQAI